MAKPAVVPVCYYFPLPVILNVTATGSLAHTTCPRHPATLVAIVASA